jgi:NAD(P)-dependent dehydrogenase (short-subunit alcohol dehydrogenase family)
VRSVLVTGASTGIGRATALRLDSAGWRVFAGVRREEDAEALRQAGSERLAPLILDITDAGLVNNAGVAIPSPLETIPVDDFRRQIEVNLTGHLAVTQAMLPLLRAGAVPLRGHASPRNHAGRIVFISSIGGRVAFPLTGAYHAAKFGIEAVGDVFRQELRPWGISVSIVEPGSIDTPIWDRGERTADEIGERSPEREALYGQAIASYRKVVKQLAERGIPPEKVAKVVEHALSSGRPRSRYLVGIDAKLQARIKPFVPTPIFDRIIARAMNL